MNALSKLTTKTGQRHLVFHARMMKTTAIVMLTMECPLGKLKLISGTGEIHSAGRRR